MPSLKQISLRATYAVVMANSLGALVTYGYLQVIDPLPQGAAAVRAVTWQQGLYFVLVMVGLMLFSMYGGPALVGRNPRAIGGWYARLKAGLPAAQVPLEIQLQVLNFANGAARISFFTWVLSWVFLFAGPEWIAARGGDQLFNGTRSFIGVVGVGGGIATVISYLLADVIWRPIIQFFFPDGRLSQLPAFRLSVSRRLGMAFLLIGLGPASLLAWLSVERARALLSHPDPVAALNNLTLVTGSILLASLLASVALAWLVTRAIVGPLQTMQAAMARVAAHDFNVKVPVTTNDELGYLAEGFNAMTAGLRQGEHTRQLLNLYISPQVAQAALQAGGGELGGQLITCTVLFSDLRDFTGLTERLPPAELLAVLNQYMSAMIKVIVAEGGLINKFGGDSILAVFGTPLNPAPDHAARAVRAAQAMRQALAEFNAAQAAAQAPQLQSGLGLATGPVVAGNVGGAERLEYTVIGDTVNLAARLQGLTKDLGHPVLLSAATYTMAQTQLAFVAEPLPPVEVRGKRDTVQVFALRMAPAGLQRV